MHKKKQQKKHHVSRGYAKEIYLLTGRIKEIQSNHSPETFYGLVYSCCYPMNQD